MDPVTLSLISMGVGSGVKLASDIFDDSNHRRANIMREEAQQKLSAFEETMRRAEGQQTQVLSSTKSKMGASGFDLSSESFVSYMGAMATEFQKQNSFARKQTMASVDMMTKSADMLDDPMHKLFAFGGDLAGSVGSASNILKPGVTPSGG